MAQPALYERIRQNGRGWWEVEGGLCFVFFARWASNTSCAFVFALVAVTGFRLGQK